ncbi:MAG: TonB-dependent receptor, partial [Leadbetterella sp.]|nr:TonB-dependent receptor [Leadbetterella sp.]
KKVKAEVNFSFTNQNRLNPRESANDNNWTNFMVHGLSRDYIPLEFDIYKNADGSKNRYEVNEPYMNYPYNNNAFKDMLWKVYENNQKLSRNQLIGSVKLSADITSWLNLTGRASMNQAATSIESKYTPIDVQGVQGEYGLENINNRDLNFEMFTTLHKNNIFGSRFNTSLLIGNSALRGRSHGLGAWNQGSFDIPFKYFIANTLDRSKIAFTESRYDFNLNSLFGIFDLSYNDYLYLQLTGRNDWSSTLPVATSSYFFPSGSLSFVFTEAIDALKDQNVLSHGKLKVSLAESANGTNPYLTQYSYSPYTITNIMNADNTQSYGGLSVRSLQTVLPPASLLQPQRNKSFEIGAELAFLNGRLSTEVTYYATRATSQILSSSVATSSGASAITFNTGELSNKGVEFIVRATPVTRSDFRWDLTLNAAHNKNKVISLADGIDRYMIAELWGTAGGYMYVREGENYGTIYGYDYTYKNGQKVVEPIYDKSNPDKVIGTRYVTTDEPVAIGNTTPKLTGGLANNFRYKRFSLYVLTDFKIGGDIFSADYGASVGHGLSPSTLTERNGGGLPYTYPDGSTANHGVILDGVYADGTPNKDVVHYMYKYAGQYMGWSNVPMPRSNLVFENSWAKLRELNLTYSLPGSFVKKTGFLQGLDVSLIGRNLFYLFTTLPDNMNPEAINGIGNGNGFQWSQYPGTRDLGFSIKARL